MDDKFFEHPILNSPYERPDRHWELDDEGKPTLRIEEFRRPAKFITPIPKPKKRSAASQQTFVYEDSARLSNRDQQYDLTSIINNIRTHVDRWRAIRNPAEWGVTPATAALLDHWRNHEFGGIRPFFCQVEAVETAIWLTEVAPNTREGKNVREHLAKANNDANPDLFRIALKLATGAGKTTVMAMLIAWQTVNAVRHPGSKKFTRGFLVVTPGLTIKDRLRVLKPNDPDAYYQRRELVPPDMLPDMERARIVITNYHAFKLHERIQLSTGGKALLRGHGPELDTLETEGQMLQRVMPELMGMKNVMVLNDEAHHCYREKPDDEAGRLTGDDRKEADKNNEAARLWITGLETVKRRIGINQVFDLSATPFFLQGSGYAEGTLFPWTVCDFSLMDAIECGIVKLPRVPVSDNIPGHEMPVFRNLWEHIRKDMPKKGRGKAGELDPLSLPMKLRTALDALYGHYEKTFRLWEQHGIGVPPCFIVVCNNTSASKLVFDYISGFERPNPDGSTTVVNGRLPLFRNYDENNRPIALPRTLLIDSEQLESGSTLDKGFRTIAAAEIERFRRERVERSGNREQAENITDQELLREAMNTVGKPGTLGEGIRCVVSVSMLTEGWDANTVTHILGVRAFGTQLLCEQVIGRSLRRMSYDLNDDGLFNVEYADVLGIPFDFNAKPVVAPPQPPRQSINVRAVSPERDHLEIVFPRITGYRKDIPADGLRVEFTENSRMILDPDRVGPSITRNEGIIGQGVDLKSVESNDVRRASLVYNLTRYLLINHLREPGQEPRLHLFGKVKQVVERWLDEYLVCKGGTYPGQLMYEQLADDACRHIADAIFDTPRPLTEQVHAVADSYNPSGSTRHVNFNTSKLQRWQTSPQRSHLNWHILDSDWEGEFCRVAEAHPKVLAYVKNHNLGFEVPYRFEGEVRHYRPDFIVLIDDGRGRADPLHVVVEIKGYRGEDAREKKATMDNYWIPGVNNAGSSGPWGRWAFAEFTEVFDIEAGFNAIVDAAFINSR